MYKVLMKTLKNGLKIMYCITPKKNLKYATLNVLFGGSVNEIKVDDEVIKIKKGTAHLLEHLIIEDSRYGNFVKYMSEDHANFNGVTSMNNTNFYFSCIDNFDVHLEELINVVNSPYFKKLDDVKGPIIEEIKEKEHQSYRKFDDVSTRQLMDYNYYDNLGTIEDIKNYDVNELKKIYDLVYKPENQILILRGNFKINKIVKLIEDTYDKLNKINTPYEVIYHNKDEVYKKREEVKLLHEDDLVCLSFKFRKDSFSDMELRKLNCYYSYYTYENFADVSSTYKLISKKKYSNYSIDKSLTCIDDYFIFNLFVYTKYEKEVLEILFNTINNFKTNLKNFELWKRDLILNFIVNSDNPRNVLNNMFENYKFFNYVGVDDIDFYNSLNIKEFKELIKKIDFNNYSITVGIKDENN